MNLLTARMLLRKELGHPKEDSNHPEMDIIIKQRREVEERTLEFRRKAKRKKSRTLYDIISDAVKWIRQLRFLYE